MHPSWDFSNPRWILGLMVLANIFHPDRCSFDIPAEADAFCRKSFGIPFADTCTNRSFFRQSIWWVYILPVTVYCRIQL